MVMKHRANSSRQQCQISSGCESKFSIPLRLTLQHQTESAYLLGCSPNLDATVGPAQHGSHLPPIHSPTSHRPQDPHTIPSSSQAHLPDLPKGFEGRKHQKPRLRRCEILDGMRGRTDARQAFAPRDAGAQGTPKAKACQWLG